MRQDVYPSGQDPLNSSPEPDAQALHQQPKSGFSKKRLILVVVGLFGLAGIGFTAALLTNTGNDTSVPNSSTQTQNETPQPTAAATTDIPPAGALKTFKSDFPRVAFTYPETWKVTENPEDQDLRVESPEFKYTSATGSTVTGNFKIYIRQGARSEDSKFIGRGIASQPSERLTYADPAPSQRPETNLSFFGLDSSDHFAFFMIAGNFSLQKDESLGPEYGTESDTYIIAGGYSSNEQIDDLATNPVPLEYFSTTNAYNQALDIIRSLKIL